MFFLQLYLHGRSAFHLRTWIKREPINIRPCLAGRDHQREQQHSFSDKAAHCPYWHCGFTSRLTVGVHAKSRINWLNLMAVGVRCLRRPQ